LVGVDPTIAAAATSSATSMTSAASTSSGSYSGSYSVGDGSAALTFYVAPGGKAIEDVSDFVGVTCSAAPGHFRSAGALIAAMTYTGGGTKYLCTSNELPWSATDP
jgi:hypothetical protein